MATASETREIADAAERAAATAREAAEASATLEEMTEGTSDEESLKRYPVI